MLLTAAFCLVLSFGFTPLTMLVLRSLHAIDIPNERSSHDRPTLRGGGVAPATAAVISLGLAPALLGRPRLGTLAAAVACFGAIGLAEDLRGVALTKRFAAQLIAAGLVVAGLLGGLGGSPVWRVSLAALTLLWIVSYVNSFNFMDGIDGISVAQAVVAGVTWFAVGRVEHADALAMGGLIAAAAALGFAPFNFPRARVFLGDVGSYAFGALLAALVVVGIRSGVRPEALIAPLSLYLADTGVTLLRRVRRGEPWYLPHRAHVYQRLVSLGWSHTRVTLTAGLWLVACSVVGASTIGDNGLTARVLADSLLVLLLLGYLVLPAVIARHSGTTSGADEGRVRPE